MPNDICPFCGEEGSIVCEVASCSNAGHFSCMGMTTNPSDEWVCPLHQCILCSAKGVQMCTICITMYCREHCAHLIKDMDRGLICISHMVSEKPQVTEAEIEFRKNQFPDFRDIKNVRLDCASCGESVKDIVMQGLVISHPLMDTLMCVECIEFYTSGVFEIDVDGTDKYCRWCGDGGQLSICAHCPRGFCKPCIMRNISRRDRKAIKREDWKCFICQPEPVFNQRAVCWAAIMFALEQNKNEQAEMSAKKLSRDFKELSQSSSEVATKISTSIGKMKTLLDSMP